MAHEVAWGALCAGSSHVVVDHAIDNVDYADSIGEFIALDAGKAGS